MLLLKIYVLKQGQSLYIVIIISTFIRNCADHVSLAKMFDVSPPVRPCEHSMSVQRLPTVVQTTWTFGQRRVNVVKTQGVHWCLFALCQEFSSTADLNSLYDAGY